MLRTIGHIRTGSHRHRALVRSVRLRDIFSNGKVTSTPDVSSHVGKQFSRYFSQSDLKRAKSTASTQLGDLPQGVLTANPLPHDDEIPSYPTVVQQARSNMRKFDNCVLLTRVGGFYELYFEHAEEFGPLLNLKVAQKKTNAGAVSMAGFPFFQLDRFLKILVQDLNRYVAVAEEFPNDAASKVKGGLLHDRKVSRIVTPGTLIDENFIDPYANNYVLSIHVCQEWNESSSRIIELHDQDEISTLSDTSHISMGLAWLDLSTGYFVTQSTNLSMLSSILSRISPKEVILDRQVQHSEFPALFSVLRQERYLVTYCDSLRRESAIDWNPMLESQITVETASEFTSEEVVAGGLLLHYVETRLQGLSLKLQPPSRYQSKEIMVIDRNSLKALEIKETIRDGYSTGSLLHAVRRTVTKGGARLLNNWLSAPSTSLDVINGRLDLVSFLLGNSSLTEQVKDFLRHCHDSQRLVQKFALGRGDGDDLLALANTILATNELVSVLKGHTVAGNKAAENICVNALIERISLDGPLGLARRIKSTIDEEGLVKQHSLEEGAAEQINLLARDVASAEGSPEDLASVAKIQSRTKPTSLREHYLENNDVWTMKPEATPTLKKLHEKLEQLSIEKLTLAQDLQRQLGTPSLTLRWTPGLGHHCHVKGKDTRNLTEIHSISSSRSTRSFHHPQWTHLGQRIDMAKIEIRSEEQRVFNSLREMLIKNLVKLRHNATVLDELDIACSFAVLAQEQGLVRPILTSTNFHKIIGGRHPTVQSGLKEHGNSFVANDCFVGKPERVWLITGPNMAGKSTFLRQNALITIMAQVGSYVPADYAEMGIVDQIFSRVGSADDLYRNQSTFMVEMLETAMILKHASPRSFVIMDEIGRGTKPEDGIAIAFASLHHLYHVNQSRTLFATHFHEVADLAKEMSEVGYYCTDVEEDEQGRFSYMHRLRKGVNKESHALKVATLAGLPEAAISVARRILSEKQNGVD